MLVVLKPRQAHPEINGAYAALQYDYCPFIMKVMNIICPCI
jgi:hypothetical protein